MSDFDVAVIARTMERDQIRGLDDHDLQALLTQTRRDLVMGETVHDWIAEIMEQRAQMCKEELNWRHRAHKRGGPSVDKRDFSDRIAAVKLSKTIPEVVALSGVELKKSGTAYRGLCPFHAEKTPSFVCWVDSGRWRCMGCAKGGDMFDYVQEWKGVDMKAALEILEGR